jgi:Zn-dependent metalloprotease
MDARHRSNLTATQVARREGDPDTGDAAVDEAYDALGVCYEFFAEQLGWTGYDDANGELRFVVHFGQRWNNMYWDGTQVVAGDGDDVVFTRFTRSLGMIGHEYALAAIQRFAPLEHRNQSGAVLQSAADVFGALVEQYRLSQKAADATWLLGENTMVSHPGVRALRSLLEPGTAFDDPSLGRDPQVAHLSHLVRSPDDDGSVHANSGIGNRAFALAAVALGGYAWQTVGPVWWQALHDSKLTARSGFRTFAAATVRAARDAAPAVTQAWQDVGVPVST